MVIDSRETTQIKTCTVIGGVQNSRCTYFVKYIRTNTPVRRSSIQLRESKTHSRYRTSRSQVIGWITYIKFNRKQTNQGNHAIHTHINHRLSTHICMCSFIGSIDNWWCMFLDFTSAHCNSNWILPQQQILHGIIDWLNLFSTIGCHPTFQRILSNLENISV
jgi:hypothetical protein